MGFICYRVETYAQWNKEFSQTLYELLIPNDFKGYGSSLRNLVLIVDKETARYPWELLHDANGISQKPMVINTGIIRQLSTSSYRKHVELNTGNRALVIGNPKTGGKYPDLQAAKNEAKNVLNILQLNTLEVTDCIEKEDIEIVQKLLTQSYKIIHIASHGVAGKTISDPSGVVIGSEIIFGAADFEQIRIVPEFVFINCCSSNQYDIAVADQMRNKYNLAASVGTQLIEMGVKAAIVTGWEIDDNAAGLFSSEFYNAMFSGRTFGDSVRSAREKTYTNFGQTNTWGAYQCYGDPFYAFRSGSGWSKKSAINYVDTVEVLYEIDNLISKIASASTREEINEHENNIENIINALPPSWKANAEIVEKFATLYKTLGKFDKAIEYYQQLFTIENAAYTVKSLEQYCNIKVRYTVKQYKATIKLKEEAIKQKQDEINTKEEQLKATKNPEILNKEMGELKNQLPIFKNELSKLRKDSQDLKDGTVEIINKVITDLEKLNGTTAERSSLIASAYKQLFDIEKNDVMLLIKTAKYYHKAYKISYTNTGILDYYSYFNWLHFAILLSTPERREKYLKIDEKQINEMSKRAVEQALQTDIAKPSFWNKAAESSYYLAQLLLAKSPEDVTKNSTSIENIFNKAWSKEGTPSDKDSFITYIELMISLLQNKTVTTQTDILDEKINALNNLITKIRQ